MPIMATPRMQLVCPIARATWRFMKNNFFIQEAECWSSLRQALLKRESVKERVIAGELQFLACVSSGQQDRHKPSTLPVACDAQLEN
jgi:hypothetical protein